jgi:asparagine synthase (glutamine-hydrolysing)
MCGISGIIRKTKDADLRAAIETITDLIKHRGPDGFGYYFSNNIAFGHRRLAIIDLSQNGHQPMRYADGKYVITYNGEVYNYLEIRTELEALGYVFQSHSDTEIILAAYQQWGEACVSRFNGMWAFAIHDVDRNIIFCSRDRFGVKPFYYTDTGSEFAFGSEIKQLLGFLPERKANREVLLNFLVTGLTDRIRDTFFAGVNQLPGGHNLKYDLGSNDYVISRYYQIKMDPFGETVDLKEVQATFQKVFTDGIALRLRSDVKVGTCLSGGLDSSSIATLASEMYGEKTGEQFFAITAASTQASNDESEFAKIVAEHGRMQWIRIAPTYEDFAANLERIVTTQEEPFGSPSIIMQYFVMKAARENGIPVLLDGQGGDETLLGYPIYHGAYVVSAYRQEGWFAALNALRDSGNKSSHSILTIFKYLVGSVSATARYQLYRWRHRYLKSTPSLPQGLVAFARASLNVHQLQNLEITQTNLPVLLRYEDKNSMAHSVETRLPFLDYRTLELALSLPGKVKIRDGWSKWILRSIMDKKMPDSIVWRKNKFGFEAPEAQWLSQHEVEMRATIISSKLLADLCDLKKLNSMFDAMNLRTKWRLYSIAMWEAAYGVDGNNVSDIRAAKSV